VLAQQLGYIKNQTGVVHVMGEQDQLVHPLVLKEEHREIGEVVVLAQKPILQQEPGKITVNIENSVSSTGLMAIDLLKRMPGVQVDNNGNISLKGKTEVQFMIDGKPSYLSAKQIAIILRSLPSNQISNIEIITSPSAKYDARGNAGIININLKKSNKKGVSGSIQAMYGHGYYHKSNVGGALSIGLKKIQLNAIYDYTNNLNLEAFTQQRNIGGVTSGNRYYQTQDYQTPTQTHNYRVTMDYTPNSRLNLGLSQRGMYVEDRWLSTNTGTICNSQGETVQQIVSHDNNPNYNSDLALSASGKYKLDSLGHEISVDGEVSRYTQRSTQNIFTTIQQSDSISTLDFHAYLPLDNTILWGKMDYTKTFFQLLKWESGVKFTHVAIDNTVQYQVTEQGNFLAKIPSNNRFQYSEQVDAAYTSLKWDSTNWGFQVGLRAEYWHAQGNLIQASFTRDSLQLFPNIMGKYKVDTQHEFSLAFSRRIDRPNYLTMNPIAYYSDPYTYYVGNPRIQPQSTYQVELAHNYLSGAVITTLNYSTMRNFISDYAVYQTSDTSKVQFMGPVNIPHYENYGVSVSLNFPITSFWSSQIFGNLYHNHFHGQTTRYYVDYQITSFSANTTQQFTLPQSWSFELSGTYSSPTVYGYSRNKAMGMISLGIKKDWLSGRISTKLNFQDIFYTFQYRGGTTIPELNTSYTYRWDNRVLSLSLTWKIDKKASLLKGKE
jgi:outer membrane receptor protein involved in Fe transport